MQGEMVNSKGKFISNTSWILCEKIVEMIIQLTVSLVSIRYLGPENYGTISYIGSYISLFSSICTLGLQGVVIKKIIDEPQNTGEIVGTSIIMRLISSLFSIICIIIMLYILEDGNKMILFLAILQSASLLFMSFEIIDFWFQSNLNSKYVSIVKMIATLIVAIWKIYLLITSKSVEYFSFSITLHYIIIAILLLYSYYNQKGQKLSISMNMGRKLIRESYHFILSGLMVVIYTQMDKVMIGKMLNNEQVGIYTAASAIPSMYIFVYTAIISSARPIILNLKQTSESKYIETLKKLYSFIIWTATVISVIMMLIGKYVIDILYGSAYIIGVNVLLIITCSKVFSILGSARSIWIVSENKNKYVKNYLVWGAIVNLILNYILIPSYGIEGAAIATLFTEITTCIISPMFYKETRVHTKYIYEAMIFKW